MFLAGSALDTRAEREDRLATLTASRVILMKDKYGRVEFELHAGKLGVAVEAPCQKHNYDGSSLKLTTELEKTNSQSSN